jgi:hypothetical protein
MCKKPCIGYIFNFVKQALHRLLDLKVKWLQWYEIQRFNKCYINKCFGLNHMSSTYKTNCHDITEILLKVGLNTIKPKPV